MENQLREIRYYAFFDGTSPCLAWVNSLKDINTQTAVLNRIHRMALGNFGDYKHLESDLFEARIHYGSGYRIYFGFVKEIMVIILHGGTKGSQKQDIKKAKLYWEDFKKRNL